MQFSSFYYDIHMHHNTLIQERKKYSENINDDPLEMYTYHYSVRSDIRYQSVAINKNFTKINRIKFHILFILM